MDPIATARYGMLAAAQRFEIPVEPLERTDFGAGAAAGRKPLRQVAPAPRPFSVSRA
jgi:hypothetical protein